MITIEKDNIRIVNLKKNNILSAKKLIIKNKALILRNPSELNLFNNYCELALSFGKSLDYNNKPYFKFDENSQQEIGFHTDGVSCLDEKKIPKYLFFLVKNWPSGKKGNFKISSTSKIISKLPTNILKILRNNKLQYLNYGGTLKKFRKKINDDDIISFQKYSMKKTNGKWTLDMFLPLKKMHKDLKWEYKMKFENLDLNDSKKILHIIRKVAESKECMTEFALKKNDILVVNNQKFFHGRNKFSEKVKRSLYRIQILN